MAQHWQQSALALIAEATVPEGILASPRARDNYRRIWARDAVITGIAGLFGRHASVLQGFEDALCFLQRHQSPWGQIPSNVSTDQPRQVSYGSFVGRVDATLWWMLGLAIHAERTNDTRLFERMLEPFERAVALTKAWEMNGRGLLYTPLGGNWADEYPIQGYTLYDQALRCWAMRLAGLVMDRRDWATAAQESMALVEANFSGSVLPGHAAQQYHATCTRALRPEPAFWWSSFGPDGYQERWDLAAHAVALLAGLPVDPGAVTAQLGRMETELGHGLPPVFYPVIQPGDEGWKGLQANYSFAFKNKPYCFHNGGSWPVFNGLLAYALQERGAKEAAFRLAQAHAKAMAATEPPFCMWEYWRSDTQEPGGQPDLCFTAAGSLLMAAILQDQNNFS
jgi:hypothetical protein